MKRYEYRLRADLPHPFPQPETVYDSFEAAEQARENAAESAPRMTTKEYRAAFEALGQGWIEIRTITEWQRVEEK